MRLLVTGGAGYIGAHFVAAALDAGISDIVVVDDLSTGLRRRVPDEVKFHQLDLATDSAVQDLATILDEDRIDAVVHFAAKKAVGESVDQPELYFRSNVGATINVLSAMRSSGVSALIFSSSAAVYGEPSTAVVYEDTPCLPINPYGQSKRISELALANAVTAWGLKAVSLRYFNVAGARDSQLADTTTTNLMPAVREVITRGTRLAVFGNDYPTPDGTCVRDYVHVLDLVDAHLTALERIGRDADPGLHTYNVGTGQGSSVLEIVHEFRQQPGVQLDYDLRDRRAGDPASLTANVDRIRDELGWTAQYGRDSIVASVVEHPPATDQADG